MRFEVHDQIFQDIIVSVSAERNIQKETHNAMDVSTFIYVRYLDEKEIYKMENGGTVVDQGIKL